MDQAPHYREKAERARQLADRAWQPELKETLRSLATDYDEIAEDIERGATGIRHADLLDEGSPAITINRRSANDIA